MEVGIPSGKEYLFPPTKYSNLVYHDTEALRYITYASTAKSLVDFIMTLLPDSKNEYTVCDMTGGLGGDSLAFLLYFKPKRLIVWEINTLRYKCLEHNLNLYMREYKIKSKYVTKNESSWPLELFDKQIIMCDPPWGGDDYRLIDKITDLWLILANKEQISIYTIIHTVFSSSGSRILILKLPTNFDFDSSKIKLPEGMQITLEFPDLHKNIDYHVLYNF